MKTVIDSCLEFGVGCTDRHKNNDHKDDYKAFIVAIGSFIIITILLCLFGKYLWNSVLVVLIPAIKPATSVFQILGMFLLTGLMFGN